jgi:hypothetical protein
MEFPGGIQYAAYDRGAPMWRMIDECPQTVNGHARLWMVALAHSDLKLGDSHRAALIAVAYRLSNGAWALDGRGDMPLHFNPNWFATPPIDPPWPPPDVPMPTQP